MASQKKPVSGRAKKKSRKLRLEITGFSIIVLAILMWVAEFSSSTAPLLALIRDGLFGLFGFLAYIIPIAAIASGTLVILSAGRRTHPGKIALSFLLLIALIGLFHLFSLKYVDWKDGFSSFVDLSFSLGSAQHGGAGALGATLTYPFLSLMDVAATYVVFVALALIFIVLLFNLSLSKMGRDIENKIRTGVSERRAQRAALELDEPELLIEDQNPNTLKRPVERLPLPKKEKRLFFTNEDDDDEPPRFEDMGEDSRIITLEGGEPTDYDDGVDVFPFPQKGATIEPAPLPPEPSNDINSEDEAEEDAPIEQPQWVKRVLSEPKDKPATRLKPRKPTREPEEAIPTPPTQRSEPVFTQTEYHADYTLPPLTLLKVPANPKKNAGGQTEAMNKAKQLEQTLDSFGIEAKVVQITRGPAITRFELTLAPGIKVRKVVTLADDIALSLAAQGVRIEAPIPGKAAIGIEIPNDRTTFVFLREILESPPFNEHTSSVAAGLGRDLTGKPIIADLSRMPHLLIAGATGSGKSACINSLITSVLYKSSPDQVKMIMIDPKVVELSVYNGIPHLISPVVSDPKKASGALEGAVKEMEMRYRMLAEKGVRDLKGYNASLAEDEPKLPLILVVIDELADLMMVAGKQVEESICRLAQMARAVGIHLIIATQRPSVDVITGLIKANVPSRIAFAVSSMTDSRTILDMGGAEKLLGMGDMLYSPAGSGKPSRIQGSFISDSEVQAVVSFIKQGQEAQYDQDFIENMERAGAGGSAPDEGDGNADALLPDVIELALETGKISTSMIQRRFRIGFSRAGRLMDEMQQRGIISQPDGARPRNVLISKQDFERMYPGEE